MNFHEDLERGHTTEGSSDRAFGLVMTIAGAVIGLWPLRAGGTMRVPVLAAAGVMLLAALVRPAWLRPLNRLWTALGVWMGKLMNPIVSAALFYLVFTPVGAVMRASGKDPMRLRWNENAESYWVPRLPPGPPAGSMSKQF
ncbi:MAG: hypothetical protein IPJ98_03885 [Bryobacterales bacterium]|nr:hypothetical protein [Bryobacterales bacterium]